MERMIQMWVPSLSFVLWSTKIFPGPIKLPEHLPRLPPSHSFLNGGLWSVLLLLHRKTVENERVGAAWRNHHEFWRGKRTATSVSPKLPSFLFWPRNRPPLQPQPAASGLTPSCPCHESSKAWVWLPWLLAQGFLKRKIKKNMFKEQTNTCYVVCLCS